MTNQLSHALFHGRRVSSRFTVVLAALALAASGGVAAARSAAADTGTPLPVPTQPSTSPAAVNGNPQDVCGTQQPYGYIGLSTLGVNLIAVVNGNPTDASVAAHFQIWPVDSPQTVTDLTSIALPPGDRVTVDVADSTFADGATYAWRVRDETSTQVSDWTQPCHFTRVLTPPPAPTVTSTTFPTTGTTPIRTYGTFTFSVPTPTRVVGFNYVLNGTLSSGGGNAFVPIGADGTATTPPLASAQWGTNSLQVQSVDIAGDVTGPVRYNFYLVDQRTAPDKHSDLNGDGNPDLAAVSSDGKLYIALGHSDGTVSAPVASALSAPQSQAIPPLTWNPSLIAIGGDVVGNDWFEDMPVIEGGRLTLLSGDGLGGFSPLYIEGRPPAGAADWSGTTQLLSPGDLDGNGRPDLLVVQNNTLLFEPGMFSGIFDTAVQAVPGAWTGLTVVGVTDVNRDGKPDLVARADKSGVVWLYPGNGDGTFSSARVRIGSGLPAAQYPHLVTKGDTTGDGYADIWATGACGNLYLIKGKADGHFGSPVVVSTSPVWKTVTALG